MASPLGLTIGGIGSKKVRDNIKYKVYNNKNVESIFGPKNQFVPFPKNTSDGITATTGNSLHNDETYDLTINSIVDYTQKYPAMALKYSDFAYLKKLGAIPNNRLIVARRFQAPVGNDLTALSKNTIPMATLISWIEDEKDVVDITFGEDWEESPASFTSILNDIGSEMEGGKKEGNFGNLGNFAAAGLNMVPLRGFMEGLIYRVYEKLGISSGDNVALPPLGNPNLIRQSKMRRVLEKDKAGSGLEGKFKVKMTVEYEQKYINGVDPSFVYLDIIQNALTFGTSDSYFQFNNQFGQKTSEFMTLLIKGDIVSIGKALVQFVQALIGAVSEVGKELVDKIINSKTTDDAENKPDNSTLANNAFEAIKDLFAKTIGNVIKKYKLKLLGVVHSLTGAPSTPWHITIGNPKRPILSTGDMLCKNVEMKFGQVLSFNDLPSTITLIVTFESARNLGAQEIFERLNTGKGRTYARRLKSSPELLDANLNLNTDNQNSGATFSGASNNSGAAVTSQVNNDPFFISNNPRTLR